ncbi:hypothetical protein IEO21_08551 [Rhodonia placenta]|uniref:Uncharacterized protein n=1 Tax=Rhodonia placenta TaxID=104341 RepID=A0A8H7NW29_9APHY|nr:hypothetical protein IEO21_08551 [Postia placenta]
MFVPWYVFVEANICNVGFKDHNRCCRHNAHWSQGWLWSGPITAQKRAVAHGVPKLTALQRGLVETYVRDVTKPVVRAWGGNDMHVRVQFSGYGSWTAVSADIPVQGLTRKELGIWVYTLILQSVELCRRELPLSNEPRSLSFRGNQPLAIDDLFVFGLSKQVYLLIKRHMTTPTYPPSCDADASSPTASSLPGNFSFTSSRHISKLRTPQGLIRREILSWSDNRSRIPRCLRHYIKHHFQWYKMLDTTSLEGPQLGFRRPDEDQR